MTWSVIGASVPGTSHIDAGRGCDDNNGWYLGERIACFAVADGAGSRKRSSKGSRAAVDATLRAVGFLDKLSHSAQPPLEEVVPESLCWIMEQARAGLEKLASEGNEITEFATTLSVAIVVDAQIGIGQIGDGYVVLGVGDDLALVSPEPAGEYVNETVFLTHTSWQDNLRLDVLEAPDVDAIAMSTDGLRFKILDSVTEPTPFGPFFEDAFAYAQSATASSDALSQFLAELPDDQTGDDKTLVLGVRRADADANLAEAFRQDGEVEQ